MAKTAQDLRSDRDDFDGNEVDFLLLPTHEEEEAPPKAQQPNPNLDRFNPLVQSGTALVQDPFARISVEGTSSIDFDDVTSFSCKGTTASTSACEGARLQDPSELHAYIVEHLSTVPPEIYMRVRGTHRDPSRREHPVVDFDFVISMRGLLTPGDARGGRACAAVVADDVCTHRGGRVLRTMMHPEHHLGAPGGMDLREWCEKYCGEKSSCKQFRVTRTVGGFDSGAVKAGVTLLLRPKYLGKVEVGFTVVDEHVDICPPKLIGRLNARHKRQELITNVVLIPSIIAGGLLLAILSCMGILVVILFWFGGEDRHHVGSLILRSVGLFVAAAVSMGVGYSLLLLLMGVVFDTKKWHIYNVNWTLSLPSEESSGQLVARKSAGLSEVQWMDKHAAFLLRLVEGKFEGDATSFIDAPLTRP